MKLVAVLVAFATMGIVPATAARLKCSDRTIVDYINKSLDTTATWSDTGEAGNSKGRLQIVGTPKTESTKKNQLVCAIKIQHTFPISNFPTSGTNEVLRARLWVNLHRDGTMADADIKFLESSK